MMRMILILLFITSCILTACSRKKLNVHPNPILIAWNEDTINSYQITLAENKNFAYAIIKKEGNVRRTKGFTGTYKFSSDSILLIYDRDKFSPENTDYLIRESSGKYLIQYFKNSANRMFLRIQSMNPRF